MLPGWATQEALSARSYSGQNADASWSVQQPTMPFLGLTKRRQGKYSPWTSSAYAIAHSSSLFERIGFVLHHSAGESDRTSVILPRCEQMPVPTGGGGSGGGKGGGGGEGGDAGVVRGHS